MSLSSALKISLSGTHVSEAAIATHSHNIANSATEGYIRQQIEQVSITTAGTGQGSSIEGIKTDIDYFLQSSMREKISDYNCSNSSLEFANRIQNLYGQPNDDNLSKDLNNFFNAFQSLSSDIDNFSLKQNAVDSLEQLLNKISSISSGLQNERFKADQKISNEINTINNLILETASLNQIILKFPEHSAGFAEIEQERENTLQEISSYIDISVINNKNNQVYIYTGKGATLLDQYPHSIDYQAAGSVDVFKEEGALSPILVKDFNENPNLKNVNINPVLVTGGVSGTGTSLIKSGSLKSYIELRDVVIPELINQLDSLSFTLTNEVNKIHNNGASASPAQSLTGTTEISPSTELLFSGNARIAIINEDGTPANSRYPDEQFIRPLNLDLSSLSNGDGKLTVQTLVDEINNFYGPPQNRVTLGDLRNINLASRNPELNNSTDNAVFDFELDSIAKEACSFSVKNVSVSGGATISNNFPTTPIEIEGGDLFRTQGNNSFAIDFTTGSGGPYTVTTSIEVVNKDGTIHAADITYVVNADNTENVNKRFPPSSAIKTSSPESRAIFIEAPSSRRFAVAEIVNANGDVVNNNESGFLKIRTLDGSNLGIAIDELDSKNIDLNSPEGLKDRGLSHFFGLNNLIKDNLYLKNSSQDISIEARISDNLLLLSTAKLSLSKQPIDKDKALYTYEVGSGDNRIPLDLSSLNSKNIKFSNLTTIPGIETTFKNYTADIISFVSRYSHKKDSEEKVEELALLGLKETFNSNFGVNTNDELAKIIELDNNFRASAKVISIVQELFDVLSNIF